MRADRLISMVMLLQAHEKMTAEELGSELEVSTRTIYRDVMALNLAGVPIFTDRGPGGGIALIDSYRTTLTGMSEGEARALFMLSIPQALVELGVEQKLKSAMYKLAAALPQSQRMQAVQTQQRIYLDPTPWLPSIEVVVQLETLHREIWGDKVLCVVFRGYFNSRIEIEIAPLGLVAKMNSWYLVGMTEGYIKVLKVKDIIQVTVTEKSFNREEGFSLEEAWNDWCKIRQDHRPCYQVRVNISPEVREKLIKYLGEGVKYDILHERMDDEDGWAEVNLVFENFHTARETILGLGRAVEVLEPLALRYSVIDYARQIIELYGEKEDGQVKTLVREV